MFKSIEYKLYFNILLLIIIVILTTYLFMAGMWVYCILSGLLLLVAVKRLYSVYNRFNKNILFLLNALDSGDYSFNFTETKLSKRERELNQMMNRIKQILSKARQETIENEKFQSLIVECISTGIIIIDSNNNVLAANRAVTQILGMPVFTHINQLGLVDESYPELFKNLKVGDNKQIKVISDSQEVQISLRISEIVTNKGTTRIIALSNIGNELEAKEMESWIRLIRVMTHEIMNSIAPITSLTDTLLLSYKNDSMLKENTLEALEVINQTAKGLVNFVDSYRKFTGIPQPKATPINLVMLLQEVAVLEAPLTQAGNITVEINSKQDNLTIYADKSQITQILINLIQNAADALKTEAHGKIRLTAFEYNEKITIDVSNNGEPIAEELLPNIFIPFFTTKETGTGIGLSVSRYIMRLHGGNLKYHTKDGWTIFSMVFNR